VVALFGEIEANAVGVAQSVKPLIDAGGPIVLDLSKRRSSTAPLTKRVSL
jgi:hypothetical protein